MSDPGQHDGDEAEAPEVPFIEKHVIPVLKEQTLWPLWIVIIGHIAAFGAWALLLAFEEGRISAYLGVFGLFWLTGTAAVAEIRQRGGPGAVSLLIAATWATTLGLAFAAKHWGIF